MAKLIESFTVSAGAQWSISVSDSDMSANSGKVVTGDTFTINYPTIMATRKSVGTLKWSAANFQSTLKNASGTTLWSVPQRAPSNVASYTWTDNLTQNTQVQIYRRSDVSDAYKTLQTSTYFNANNKTSKSVNLSWTVQLQAGYYTSESSNGFKTQGLYSTDSTSASTRTTLGLNSATKTITWSVPVTLNAPPTFTSTNVSFNESYHVAGHTTASVTISDFWPKYGADATVTLTIGSQTASRTSNGTLSIACNKAGTFTPKVTMVDSRGQTTTKNLAAITINSHTEPTFTASQVSFSEAYHVANHTRASVTISNLSAKQGASISSVVLKIGSQTASRTTNGTLYIDCNKAGTYTPVVVVTDTWGASVLQKLNAITINSHTAPTLTTTQVSFDAPAYANYCNASVTISSATAYQGSSISSIKFTLGSQSVTRTTNGTLTIACNAVGTFTPTVTITDNWGGTQTYTLNRVTVSQYVSPAVVVGVERTTSAGVANDEGTSAVVSAKLTYTYQTASLQVPTVAVTDNDGTAITGLSVTWYTSRALTTAISDWSTVTSESTVYALITDNDGDEDTPFDTQYSYQIKVTPRDTRMNGNPITATLGGAYYTVDFLAGGHGIAFGAPSVREGFFCNMDMFLGLPEYQTSDTDDKALYDAIDALNWQNDVIE